MTLALQFASTSMRRSNIITHTAIFLLIGTAPELNSAENAESTSKPAVARSPTKIWRDPGDTSALDLFYGAGGRSRTPYPKDTYVFIKIAISGASPKFDVKDEHGVEWRVKLGEESRTETAATRLLWAAGYFVDEDYFLPELRVKDLPETFLSQVGPGARLERRDTGYKNHGDWSWNSNPFEGTQEFDGLRVMMALLNNWDLKTSNNSIIEVDGERRYLVSDVGATFGKTGGIGDRTKGRLDDYATSKFIDETNGKEVDLTLKSRPPFLLAVDFYHYQKLAKREKVGKEIPRAHAKWLGEILARLSEDQIRDCFRAAGFSPPEVEGYTVAVRRRIAQLNAL